MRHIYVSFVLLSLVACSSLEQQTITLDSVARMRVDSDAGMGPMSSDASSTTATEAAFAMPGCNDDDDYCESYSKLRVGWFKPDGDIDALDDGFIADITFGRKFLRYMSIEGSVGYFEAGVPDGDDKLWGVPLFVNARASLPIWILEPYVGAGAGGIYTEYPSNTDFVWAWNAMLGVGICLGDFQLGAEYRFLQSFDETDDDFKIEGQAASVFAQVPF